MLEHYGDSRQPPKRVVVLGANGFIARALVERLRRQAIMVKPIGRGEIDLAAVNAEQQLSSALTAGDALVFLSAVTPDKGRGIDAFLVNLRMGAAVCAAVAAKPPAQVVYVSSDAVYPFTEGTTEENSCAEPKDLYGAAHLARELMVKTAAQCPIAILRPTLIYGPGDTHNSYGANRFRRMARKEGRITLFGDGEETRDHIYIDDIVSLIVLTLQHRSAGTLNLVSGRSISFAALARMVAGQFSSPIEIVMLPRQTAVTHRKFDASGLHRAFPAFRMTALEEGIASAHAAAD